MRRVLSFPRVDDEVLILLRQLLALFVFLTFSVKAHAADWAASIAANGFALLTHADGPPPQAGVGGATCDTFDAPPSGPKLVLPVDAKSAVTLGVGALPPLPAGSLGWQISMQFDADAADQNKRTGYTFISAEALDAAHVLMPPGRSSATATLHARPVWPVSSRRSFDLGVLPDGARFQVGYALQTGWRIEGACGSRFVVSVVVDGGAPKVIGDATLTYRDQAEAAPPWTPMEADLSAYAEKKVSLLLETFDAPGVPTPNLAVPLWGDPIVFTSARPTEPKQPSVLLVSLDTVRADRLGCYGYGRGTTPNLDALAGESILFENALTPAPMTTPAHASVFNGVSPYLHRAGVYSEGFRLSTKWAPLGELLAPRGYRTAAFTEGIAVAGSIGFARGFQSYSDGISPRSHDKQLIGLTFGDAAEWLEKFGHFPSLLFVHTYHAHDPYSAPDAVLNRFTDPDYRGRLMAHASEAKTPEERRNASDCYDAGLAHVDDKFGAFVGDLKAAGLLDNRWLIVFSDHGEEFWEHGGTGHARALYRESVHVPLIIRPPGGLSGGGQRVSDPVLITDLFATILTLTGTAVPEDRDSRDLLAIAKGSGDVRTALHGFFRGYEFPKWGQGEHREWETFSVRVPAYTYVTNAPKVGGPTTEELFAPEDAAEKNDLAAERPELLEEARSALKAHRTALDGEEQAPKGKPGLEQSEVDALQGLGYF